MTPIDKAGLVADLRERLTANLYAMTESQRASQAGATHEESRSEHSKDTRATEASYLARGLAKRVGGLQRDVALLEALEIREFGENDSVALAALVSLVDAAGALTQIFLLPAGGGEKLMAAGQTIRCTTPGSPLGRSLMGREAGDEVVLQLPGGTQRLEIAAIR